MVKTLLRMETMHSKFDATDAAAIAICHYFMGGKPQSSGKSYSGWSSFVSQNPDKLK
jgi:crossover junction endodeoxyribonuclease RuvC